MQVKLLSGAVLDGTAEQIGVVLKALGEKGIGNGLYYFSETKGPVLITEMNSMHLRNAILKFYADWVKELHTEIDPKVVVKKIVAGISDPTWLAMVKELSKRKE